MSAEAIILLIVTVALFGIPIWARLFDWFKSRSERPEQAEKNPVPPTTSKSDQPQDQKLS